MVLAPCQHAACSSDWTTHTPPVPPSATELMPVASGPRPWQLTPSPKAGGRHSHEPTGLPGLHRPSVLHVTPHVPQLPFTFNICSHALLAFPSQSSNPVLQATS